ncbi:hypothetical protein NKG94_32755 [Micromonospora sp. M12]
MNTSGSYTEPSGRLDVVELASRTRVASLDLGGQPDSIAISKDKRYAAIAIENERDEEATRPAARRVTCPRRRLASYRSSTWPGSLRPGGGCGR